MLHYSSIGEAEEFFKAMSAPARVHIMNMVYTRNDVSINELATELSLTSSAISIHVAKLQKAGLVSVESASGRRGNTKFVRPVHDRFVIDPVKYEESRKFYSDDIPIGYFTNHQVSPTCGLATEQSIIGEFDDTRYFDYPDRFKAGIMWFCKGFVEYQLPNRLQAGQKLEELQISFEISSEFPGINNDYPSDIYFYINGKKLGFWVSPGDFGERKGFVSPAWWPAALNQYGLLKTLIINSSGTFIDGDKKISDVTADELEISYASTITFRLEVPEDAVNCGGITIFGESFGDYGQAIRVKTLYSES